MSLTTATPELISKEGAAPRESVIQALAKTRLENESLHGKLQDAEMAAATAERDLQELNEAHATTLASLDKATKDYDYLLRQHSAALDAMATLQKALHVMSELAHRVIHS